MKLQIVKFAMVGAVALTAALVSSQASAQPVAMEFEAGIPETINVTATVSNTINASVTQPNMGVWGVIGSNGAGDQAVLAVSEAGVQTGTAGSGSADAVEGGGATAGVVAITGAFNATPINVTFSAPVNLTCAACLTTPPALQIASLLAELTPPATGVTGTDATLTVTPANVATAVTGTATTTATGDLSFNIGISARTIVSAVPYESGTYAGSFDMLIEY